MGFQISLPFAQCPSVKRSHGAVFRVLVLSDRGFVLRSLVDGILVVVNPDVVVAEQETNFFEGLVFRLGEEEEADDHVENVGRDVDEKVFPAEVLKPVRSDLGDDNIVGLPQHERDLRHRNQGLPSCRPWRGTCRERGGSWGRSQTDRSRRLGEDQRWTTYRRVSPT